MFGSDICTCRPYLTHGIEEATRQAQAGGAGLIVYNRKEGRALGEVTKFLVYNARKRQPGGDQAATYFERTECVAGVQDARFQQLMPDVIHWLGIRRIDRFVSMSNMKYDALVGGGIEIGERVPIPDDLVPPDASVEMEAKKAAGYYTPDGAPSGGAAEGRGRPGSGEILRVARSDPPRDGEGDRAQAWWRGPHGARQARSAGFVPVPGPLHHACGMVPLPVPGRI